MKFITIRVHAVLDYLLGALLLAAPVLFGFENDRIETYLPVILGTGIILYSLLTDYELSISKMIPFRTHLRLDMIGGVLLAVSPWLFGFADFVYGPHLLIGLIEIGIVLCTVSPPDYISGKGGSSRISEHDYIIKR